MQLLSVSQRGIVLALLILGLVVFPDLRDRVDAQGAGTNRESVANTPNIRLTGTYTNMYFHREAGDLLGEEIKIVKTRQGYQGALQFSEGEPGDLIIVNIRIDGKNVNFQIPNDSSYAGQFSGTIENGILKGKFLFKTGGMEDVELKKGKGYWD
jgi:hypothetical protein